MVTNFNHITICENDPILYRLPINGGEFFVAGVDDKNVLAAFAFDDGVMVGHCIACQPNIGTGIAANAQIVLQGK